MYYESIDSTLRPTYVYIILIQDPPDRQRPPGMLTLKGLTGNGGSGIGSWGSRIGDRRLVK